jgi:predicted HicB family RNase H-like nuclease
MTKKELKKLSRADLIEMLIDQSIELNDIKEKYQKAQGELDNQNIAIDNAGSIAEASLHLTDVFLEAEKAAQIYLQNIQLLSDRQEAICSAREKECLERCAEREKECQAKIEARMKETEQRCNAMLAHAKKVSQNYWEAVSKKLSGHHDSKENSGATPLSKKVNKQ